MEAATQKVMVAATMRNGSSYTERNVSNDDSDDSSCSENKQPFVDIESRQKLFQRERSASRMPNSAIIKNIWQMLVKDKLLLQKWLPDSRMNGPRQL
jgi:hypothetical protein